MRSWWGWGEADAAADAAELDELAGTVAAVLDLDPGPPLEPPPPAEVPLRRPRVSPPDALAGLCSTRPADRLRHGHGQSFRDVARAVRGRVPHPPDVVARPHTVAQVRRVLEWCSRERLACVPYGGGTSVVGGVTPPAGETVSLDLGELDGVPEVDRTSRSAHVEAGATGPAIDDALRPHGLALRHYPQSWEFSTLGGWIATRAGGHYATGPTHIDDLVEAVSAQTPAGPWESRRLPASGAGPSPDRLLLGSEGALGVITDAWVRVQPRPDRRARATVRFDTFRAAARAVRALAQSGLQPANCRVLDPVEAMLAGLGADGGGAGDTLLLLGFESADHPLDAWIDRGLELARDHGGRCPDGPRTRTGTDTGAGSGREHGRSESWRRAFLRAPYLRDALVRLGMVVETFETAVCWDGFDDLVAGVRAAAREAAEDACGQVVIATRITHAYPDGAAPYFTVVAPGGDDPVGRWDHVKAAVSEAILAAGGTITHHHAVGRDHRPWYRRQRPRPLGGALRAVKDELDPAGVLNPGVLLEERS